MPGRNPRLSVEAENIPIDVADGIQQSVSVDAVPLSQYLWDQNARYRKQALDAYFVQGIGNGNLNPTAFGGYMVQDSVYCYKAKLSIDQAESRASAGVLKQYLQKESASYESYYKALFAKWHIAEENGILLNPAVQSYADYEHEVAGTMDTIYMIVAMIPCMKLWPWLGQEIHSGDHGVYEEWFKENFDPTYIGYRKLDQFVDRAAKSGTIDRNTALQVYTRCMQGEFEFFNSVKSMY